MQNQSTIGSRSVSCLALLAAFVALVPLASAQSRSQAHKSARTIRHVPASGTYAALGQFAGSQDATGENVLIVIADDLGVDKVGVYGFTDPAGNPLAGPTPTLDRLAQEGVTFRNAWSNPVCSPTRATCLTGQYAFRTGIGRAIFQSPIHTGLSTRFTALPEAVADDVRTAVLGKWHLGDTNGCMAPQSCTGSGWHPIYSGFELHAGSFGNIRASAGWTYERWPKIQSLEGGGIRRSTSTKYATTDTTDDAIRAVRMFGDQPWMVWVSYNAPHVPFHQPPPNLYSGPPATEPVSQVKAMTQAMDAELDRLLESMDPDVLARTTIVFFGDNGTSMGAVETPFSSTKAKGSLFNGGINVPFIVAGARVAPSARGSVCDALVNTTDVYATTVEICGGDSSTGVDSVSLVPYLDDPAQPSRRDYILAEKFVRNFVPPATPTGYRVAIRDQRYKLIQIEGQADQFYDVTQDFHENVNLLVVGLNSQQAQAYADLIARLAAL